MTITTITCIVAGVALSVAVEFAILHILGMRKISKSLKDIKEQMTLHGQDPMKLLVNKYAPAGDFEEYTSENNSQTTTQFVGIEKDSISGQKVSGTEGHSPSPNDAKLKMAQTVFLQRYEELCDGLNAKNYKERAQNMGQLLIEMGLWLKDFLPVSQNDFNATKSQYANASIISLTDEQRYELFKAAPRPTGSTEATPIEVIALNHILQKWGIESLNVLMSGYKYQPE